MPELVRYPLPTRFPAQLISPGSAVHLVSNPCTGSNNPMPPRTPVGRWLFQWLDLCQKGARRISVEHLAVSCKADFFMPQASGRCWVF